MDLESACTTASTVDETASPSSLTAEPSISDSSEPMIPNENDEAQKIEEEQRKNHRLARRKSLALTNVALAAPKLGKILASTDNTIDLTVEDDDPSNKWFKKTFAEQLAAKKKKSPEGKNFAVPHNIPKIGLKREDMKKQLQASMSAKRRKEQEQRRKMYQEDNDHLQNHSDEEDEEEEIIKKKKKKSRRPKDNEEYNSEDDEDYQPEDSPAENSSDEELVAEKKDEKADDEVSVNFMNDSFTFDVFNIKKRGPGSTASSFDVRSQVGESTEKNNFFGDFQIPGGTSGLFDLCADSFVGDGVQDTLQMLLNEDKKKEPKEVEKTALQEEEEEEDDVINNKNTKSKASRVLDSDDEDVDEVEETPELKETLPQSLDIFESDEPENAEQKEEETEKPRRIVVSGDEDSESEQEEEEQEEEIEDEEEEEDVQEEEEVPAPEPNFDDEDDELAVIKRIEHKEYSQKIKKKTLFDDEASLSGDDVGSDLDDEEGVENLYEAEEGDADDVPDDDTIRRENYKLMLKQENAKEQRALAKLQDRLLADGDLGGIETNRQFRFKLREDADAQVGVDDGEADDQEEDEPEESEEAKKARAEMIKYRIEHAEELEMLAYEEIEEDEVFRRAGIMIKNVKKTVVESSEDVVLKRCRGKPSLLSKTSLAVSFQEVLGGSGGAAPKQMYVQNRNQPSTSSEPSRSGSGGVKRSRRSPEPSAAKRVRQGKLSVLE